jgi:sporulation protein YlmC with PRC-barrel domain
MRFLIRLIFCFASALTAAANRAQPAQPSSLLLRLDEVLWREVQNRAGETLGSVSDVLAQMPSGRLVFVAVVPSEFFERPKAVPPGAIVFPDNAGAPLQLDIPNERWINAPRLDWDAALVIKHTSEGERIYGYYQQAWQEPDPTPPWGMTVVAPPADVRERPARYVSLKDILLHRVVTPVGHQAGFVRDFLVDWTRRYATHALVSPRFTPLAKPDAMWLAIPTPLLNPPVADDAITANTDLEALRRAEPVATGVTLSTSDRARIFRYPAAAP